MAQKKSPIERLKRRLRKFQLPSRRIAFMAMAMARGKVDRVESWLRDMGYPVERIDDLTLNVQGPGMKAGITVSDPITCATCILFALFGTFWPMMNVGQEAFDCTNILWKTAIKQGWLKPKGK